MTFKAGDKVRVRKPCKDRDGYYPFPGWANSMDAVIGQVVILDRQYGAHWTIKGDSLQFIYRPEWLTLVPETPALDLTKPVQTRDGTPVRILCTDAPERNGQTVVGFLGDNSYVSYWFSDGLFNVYRSQTRYDLVNVPPPKEKHTYDLVMHRSASGCVQVGRHKVGWQPNKNTVIARKTVTIEEGEGMGSIQQGCGGNCTSSCKCK